MVPLTKNKNENMNTLSIVIIVATAFVMLIVLAAYISVLQDDRDHYKEIAETFEELFFLELNENNNEGVRVAK